YGYGAFTASIVLNHNHHQRHHRFYERRSFTRRDWAKRWAYRSHAPVIIRKNRKIDNIHVKKRKSEIRGRNASRRVVKARYEERRPLQKARKEEIHKQAIQEKTRGKRAYAIQRQKGISHKNTKDDGNSKSRKASRRMKKKTAYRNK
ncbi:MAG: hypothetical protein ACE5I1_27120, partial [bacterium]